MIFIFEIKSNCFYLFSSCISKNDSEDCTDEITTEELWTKMIKRDEMRGNWRRKIRNEKREKHVEYMMSGKKWKERVKTTLMMQNNVRSYHLYKRLLLTCWWSGNKRYCVFFILTLLVWHDFNEQNWHFLYNKHKDKSI